MRVEKLGDIMGNPVVDLGRRVQIIYPHIAAGTRDVLRSKTVRDRVVEHPREGVPRREQKRGDIGVSCREVADTLLQEFVPCFVDAAEGGIRACKMDT